MQQTIKKLERLDGKKLDRLSKALLTFKDQRDLQAWLVTIQVSFLRMQESPVFEHMIQESTWEIPAFAGMTGDS